MLIQPQRGVFNQVFPQINYDDMDKIYYSRVIAQIAAGWIPDDILASKNYAAHRAFIRDAMVVGFEVSQPYSGFDWEIIHEEINGSVPAAASISKYIYGCNRSAAAVNPAPTLLMVWPRAYVRG